MKKWLLTGICIILIGLYFWNTQNDSQSVSESNNEKKSTVPINEETVTSGTDEYRGFLLDNVLHSQDNGDIHYNVYIPDSYDGSEPYALYFTLPGCQGLYLKYQNRRI